MNILNKYRRFQGLAVGYTLLASCLVLWGCPQAMRYPAVVYDVPRCYDTVVNPAKACEDLSRELYLNLDFLAKSDSVLWTDITSVLKNGNTKFWRLNVFRSSNGELMGSTYQKDTKTDWKPVTDKPTTRMALPLEVLLRADFEFCSEDTSEKCEAPSAKPEGRNINFLMHEYPEKAFTLEKK